MVDLNKVQSGVLAGLVVGLVVGGTGARIAMRGVALMAGMQPEFSVGGTLAILVLGAILGVPAGLLFVAARRFLPVPARWKGLIFGLICSLLFIAPFFLSPQGELALVSPLVGASLFGPIPILYAVALAVVVDRMERRPRRAPPRHVGAITFTVFGLALVGAFIRMLSLGDLTLPFPPTVSRALREFGLTFRASHEYHGMLALVFALAYCGLVAMIFWRGAGNPIGSYAAIALLAFAAAFFHSGDRFAMSSLPVARLGTGLIRVLGLGSLLSLFYLFPDGRFVPRWTRRAAVIWWAWLLVWLLALAPGSRLDRVLWSDALFAGVVVGGLGSGILAQIYRYRRETDPLRRRQLRWVIIGLTAAVVGFAVLFVATLLVPGLRLRNGPPLASLFTFVPFLIPWLLIPLSMVHPIRHLSLWSVDAT